MWFENFYHLQVVNEYLQKNFYKDFKVLVAQRQYEENKKRVYEYQLDHNSEWMFSLNMAKRQRTKPMKINSILAHAKLNSAITEINSVQDRHLFERSCCNQVLSYNEQKVIKDRPLFTEVHLLKTKRKTTPKGEFSYVLFIVYMTHLTLAFFGGRISDKFCQYFWVYTVFIISLH